MRHAIGAHGPAEAGRYVPPPIRIRLSAFKKPVVRHIEDRLELDTTRSIESSKVSGLGIRKWGLDLRRTLQAASAQFLEPSHLPSYAHGKASNVAL
jgi:hypothetical protein